MRALLITMSVTLVAAAAGIGVLAISPAPERPDSLTLVIETGSIPRTTASKEQPADSLAGESTDTTTGALGTSSTQADASRREQTLDEVIAARLREAERSGADEPAAAAASPEEASPAVQPTDTPVPGMSVDTQPAGADFAAAEPAQTPSGTISITEMLAAELGDDEAEKTDGAQETEGDESQVARRVQPERKGDLSVSPARTAESASAEVQPETDVAALDPRVAQADGPDSGQRAAADAVPIGETPDQLRESEPEATEQSEPEQRGVALAAGEAPPAPSQRGRFRVKGRIALVIRGLGVNRDLTARTIETMPSQVALGFVPYGEGLKDWTQKARRGQHDVLIQIPLEPQNYPETNPGPHTLLTSLSIDENLKRLDWLLDRFEGITGVSNYLGGKFASAPGTFAPVLMELKARELIYIDDGKAANPMARQLARQVSLSYAVADGVIDEGKRTPEAVSKELEKVEAIARSEGKAIAVGHAHTETLDTLKGWIAGLSEKGLVLESVKGLLTAPPARQVSRTTDG